MTDMLNNDSNLPEAEQIILHHPARSPFARRSATLTSLPFHHGMSSTANVATCHLRPHRHELDGLQRGGGAGW